MRSVLVTSGFLHSPSLFSQQSQNGNLVLLDGTKNSATSTYFKLSLSYIYTVKMPTRRAPPLCQSDYQVSSYVYKGIRVHNHVIKQYSKAYSDINKQS